jgi:hydrophobe/amphiphile efflux-1 (HAE1) family protein
VSLASISIKRPVFAWMLMIALIVFGGIAFTRLGVSQYPDIDLPVVNIQLSLPGAAPEVMESDVVDPLESAVIQVEGLVQMSSTCRQSMANIKLEFELNRDIDAAIQDVQTRLAQVQRLLPRDMDPTVVQKSNPEDMPILWIGVWGTRPLLDISEYIRNTLKDQFQTIPGVGDISMSGYRERNVRVWLDSKLLQSYDLTVDDVMSALAREHVELPAGRIETANRELNIRAEGEAVNMESFRNLIIADRSGAQILLRDVAVVEDGMEDKRRVARVNGMPAMGLAIRKVRGANAVEVAHAVKAKLAVLQQRLPEGIEMALNYDATISVEDAIHDIQIALALAVLLTAFVCWMFLGSFSSTFNVLMSIPTSLIGTLAVMYFMGFTINTFTLLAISLSVGIVVDDAIMVMENIYRHGEMGKDRVRASTDGATEITFAAIVATGAIMAIFLPIAFMKGLVGKFLFQFGVVLSVAVAFSLLEALTITPARCAQILNLKSGTNALGRLMERLMHGMAVVYQRLLGPTLKFRYLVILGAVATFVLTIPATKRLLTKFEMVPPQDQSRFMMQLRTPVGSSIDYTDARAKLVEEYLASRPEVNRFYMSIGGFSGGEVDSAASFITLKPPQLREKSQKQIIDDCRRDLNKIPGLLAIPFDPSTNLPGTGGRGQSQVGFYIQGQDWKKLTELTTQFMDRLNASGVAVDVDSDYRLGAPEVRIRPDRQKASDLGISMESIGRTVDAMVGGLRIVKFKDQGRRYDVRVRLLADQRLRPEDVETLYVRSRSGQLLHLGDVVRVVVEPALLSITRENRSRAINLMCNPAPGRSPTEVVTEAQRIADEILPGGYSMVLAGASKSSKETVESLGFALVLGIVIAYMILAAQFNSFIHPITVLIALPFSLTGAVLALAYTGNSLNMFSMIGIVLLMGIVKKNSILLVDFTNQRREEGLSVRDAIVNASPTRLRPILMTTVSTIAGAIPAAMSLDLSWAGLGAAGGMELRAPMAIAVIGGLSLSTLLTLFVVPAVYAMFEDIKGLFGIGRRPAVAAAFVPESVVPALTPASPVPLSPAESPKPKTPA